MYVSVKERNYKFFFEIKPPSKGLNNSILRGYIILIFRYTNGSFNTFFNSF